MLRGAADRVYPLALMLALALLTLWLDRAVREERGVPTQRRHDPDFIVDRFTVTNFDREGKVVSTLAARRMVHYPDDDSTELEAPRVVETKPGEPRMTLTAARGNLSQDGADVFLHDDVLLVREALDAQPEQRLRTSFLHVVRSRSILRTDRDVEIVQADRRISARGMEYHNETQQLFLRENVRGTIEPKKPNS